MGTQSDYSSGRRVEVPDQVYNLSSVDAEHRTKLAPPLTAKCAPRGSRPPQSILCVWAVLAALNIADEYHILKKKYDLLAGEFNRRAGR